MTERDEEDLRALRWLIAIFIGYGLISLLCVGFVMVLGVRNAFSQDCEYGAYGCGHEGMHQEYQNWKSNYGGSCCSATNGECRPIRATKDEEGNWRIFIPELRDMTVGDAIIKGWLYVPPSQIQKEDLFKDGRSHACTSRIFKPGSAELRGFTYYPVPNVYCFTPAETKG